VTTTVKMTDQGQIEIPIEIRNELGIVPGSELEWTKLPDGRFAVSARTTSIKRLKGIVKWNGPTTPIQQLNSDTEIAAADAKGNRSLADREMRFARLRAQIAATPPSVLADYQQETADWEATELADDFELREPTGSGEPY